MRIMSKLFGSDSVTIMLLCQITSIKIWTYFGGTAATESKIETLSVIRSEANF